jgi:ribosomal protein S1
VRLAGASSGATTAIVPRSEIAWHPVPSAADELHAGDRVRGCVVDLGVDGPILSLRAVAPSPWPAIALELPPGTAVRLRVRSVGERGALARLVEQPHVATLVPRADFEPGQALTATVERVDVELGRLHLEGVTPARAG